MRNEETRLRSKTSLSVIIPAYNEESRIENTLIKVCTYLKEKNYKYEVIVVDDGSTDSTLSIVKGVMAKIQGISVVRNPSNLGKGIAVKKGVNEAVGEYIFFTDADLSTPIDQVTLFLRELDEKSLDVVIGSRGIVGANIIVPQPFHRRLLGRVFSLIVKLLFGLSFIDTQCGAKIFRRDVAKKIFGFMKTGKFAFDVEILYIAKLFNYRVEEMPVTWVHSGSSSVNPITDGFKMLVDILKIKLLYLNARKHLI